MAPMDKVQIIIQARMTSTRLPGKVMLPLCGKSVLQVMLERLEKWHDNIIIATTDDGSEAPIVDLCKSLDIAYFQGSTEDVLGRYYLAATKFGAKEDTAIVRLTSDCPLIDCDLVSEAIGTYLNHDFDAVSLGPHSGFPRGLDTAVFSYKLLQTTHEKATSTPDREHVTLGMSKFSSYSNYVISAMEDLSHYRLTLDEQDDYTAIKAIYEKMHGQIIFSFAELLLTLKKFPHLADINKHVEQKTV
ncbi:polysaccharide biosynthesis protein [Pseudoalteromonas sp. GCY]|uniref:cytidylyltransferase domain-containing protein n=1 Tax=Pseudoalteromonas sp. GCY TaxID=2003316 RepID=UPI000BFEEA04|nr:glycosyltransferase family protein [Pseudoalteromonas sp. GCY]PHI36937.1 polysaccharide biosynthesis protein [Pseudoalteromonas sp. GCY]QQQ68330.1 glycosyltransferase family protein [Pseudoalteromonas sp. GCY]